MAIVKITDNKSLKKSEKVLINENRVKEFGKSAVMDFSTDYEPNTKWFFLKGEKGIVAFGGLRPIKIEYFGEKYSLLGICSIISIIKDRRYGED